MEFYDYVTLGFEFFQPLPLQTFIEVLGTFW